METVFWGHGVEHTIDGVGCLGSQLAAARRELEQARAVLRRIADWPYDIMGDCVAEARKEAAEAAKK
jgi:nitrogenase subunit NifH